MNREQILIEAKKLSAADLAWLAGEMVKAGIGKALLESTSD